MQTYRASLVSLSNSKSSATRGLSSRSRFLRGSIRRVNAAATEPAATAAYGAHAGCWKAQRQQSHAERPEDWISAGGGMKLTSTTPETSLRRAMRSYYPKGTAPCEVARGVSTTHMLQALPQRRRTEATLERERRLLEGTKQEHGVRAGGGGV
jgi:hypothetical protein